MKKITIVLTTILLFFTITSCFDEGISSGISTSSSIDTSNNTSNSSVAETSKITIKDAIGNGTVASPYEIELEEEEEYPITLSLTQNEKEIAYKLVKKEADQFVDLAQSDLIGVEVTKSSNTSFSIKGLKAGSHYVQFFYDVTVAYLKVIVSEKPPVVISGMNTWVVSSYENVFKDATKTAESKTSIDLVVAKNEYESVQILVRSLNDFTINGVEFTDLEKEGKIISKDNLDFNYVEYQYFASNTNSLDFKTAVRYGPNNYPDALSNADTMVVVQNNTQPIWVTLFIPKEVEAGIYTGKAVIKTTLGDITVNIAAEVNNVVIPDTKNSEYSVHFWQRILAVGFGASYSDSHPSDTMVKLFGHERWTPEWWEVVDDIAKVMKENRINQLYLHTVQLLLDGGSTLDGAGKYTFNWSKFDEYVQYFLDRDIVKGFMGFIMMTSDKVNVIKLDGQGRPMTSTLAPGTAEANNWFDQYLPALNQHLEEKGWLNMWIQSIRDEPQSPADLAQYSTVLGKIRQYAPRMKVAETITNTTVADYMLKNIDVLIPLLNIHNENEVMFDQRLKETQEIFSYTCVVPSGTYLNRFIDKPVWHGRSLAWYNYYRDTPGFLHWGLMEWYRPITDFALGDTASIYPDVANNSIKSTIRLAALRDGAEDFDLLTILEETNPSLAKTLAEMIAKDANINYSKDISQMLNVRALLVRAAGGDFKAVDSITFDESELTLKIGDTVQLNADITPTNALIKDVVWTSSDSSVVKVDEKGEIYVVSYGTAKITVTSIVEPSIKAECIVNVPYNDNYLVFYPGDDATVGNATVADKNFGEQGYLAIVNSATLGRKAYLKFNVGGLEGNVTKAVIRLHAYQINKDTTRTLEVFKTSSDWSESEVTWNNAPVKGEMISSVTILNDTGANDTTGRWIDIDITNHLDSEDGWISIVIENNGVESNNSGVYFTSIEKGPEQNWPRLIVEDTLD